MTSVKTRSHLFALGDGDAGRQFVVQFAKNLRGLQTGGPAAELHVRHLAHRVYARVVSAGALDLHLGAEQFCRGSSSSPCTVLALIWSCQPENLEPSYSSVSLKVCIRPIHYRELNRSRA